MNPIAIVLALALSTLFLSGCAGFVESDVAVFHQLGETPIPKTFAFFPLNVQEDSAGYKTYAALIRRELGKYQYKEVAGEEYPDVVIALSYGIDSGREKLVSIPSYSQSRVFSKTTRGAFGAYGNYRAHFGSTVQKPTYGIGDSYTISRTEYDRSLWLYIVDANSLGTEKLNVLYEGNAKSSGSSSQLSEVIPAMIEALFKSFPGKSGETRREIVPIQ
jgi:hypothetical protein